MKIDLHIHSKNGSDGRWSLEKIFAEANRRNIDVISITDHDSIYSQDEAKALAAEYGIRYLTGVELNVTLTHPAYKDGKGVSLDFLGYGYDANYKPLVKKLHAVREFRQKRAEKILENINREFRKENLREFTSRDMEEIRASVDGSFGRPHIADYMIKKGIVSGRQEAFGKYLVKCDVPKMPMSLEEASGLIRGAGGKLVLAHPGDPNGTSLVSFTSSIEEQLRIIKEVMIHFIDGIECWHHRHDRVTRESYLSFARREGLIVTGGSDCHQQPVIMGTVDVPEYVAQQFGL
ncbi:MAG: PHP domain-containing protein [Proteobacteria bacterium]|nr:PHP domain-containing protein [Pseudomonadota bacterium]